MTTTTADPQVRPLKLFANPHWPLALGAIGLVTLGTFENRAVGTALPTLGVPRRARAARAGLAGAAAGDPADRGDAGAGAPGRSGGDVAPGGSVRGRRRGRGVLPDPGGRPAGRAPAAVRHDRGRRSGAARPQRGTADAGRDVPRGAGLPDRGAAAGRDRGGVRRGGRVPAAAAHAAPRLRAVAGRDQPDHHRRDVGVRVLAAGPRPPRQPVVVLRTGLSLMTAGLAGTTTLAWTELPAWAGLSGWAVAGIGMGLSSPTLAVLTLDLAGDDHPGRYTSAALMAGSVSMATSCAISGTLLAVAAPDPGRDVFGAVLTAGVLIAALGLLATGRVTGRPAGAESWAAGRFARATTLSASRGAGGRARRHPM